MLLSEGEDHKRHRRLASAAFHFDALKDLAPLISESAAVTTDAWLAELEPGLSSRAVAGAPEALSDEAFIGADVELHQRISGLTLQIIGRAAFASDDAGASAAGGASSVYATLTSLLESAMSNRSLPIPGWEYVPTPGHVKSWRQV
jgi:cytochrome P450